MSDDDDLNPAITSSTADPQTWSLVQTWLGMCTEMHQCSRHAAEGFVPTRLLELDYAGREKSFRLVDSADLDAAAPYVSLSHCWGTGPVEKKLRLLGSTEDLLRRGLPLSRLPRLFRDAVEIAERLRIRYIWIDRLCIIQDSGEDWEAEAATMQMVYQNGFLNIAALGARDDQEGCFFDREPLLVAPTLINLSPPGYPPLPYRFSEEDEGWKSTFEGDLITRAWVLQERVLAPRTLYFGRKQVFWECGEANHCETVPRNNLVTPAAPQLPKAPPTAGEAPVRRSWKALIDPAGRSYGDWTSIVRAYSQCRLTFAADKLVALSGLAKDMCAANSRKISGHGAYVAGHWRDTMPQNLIWSTSSWGHRPAPYRAPSWSWASVDGDVSFPQFYRQSTLLAKLIGVKTVPRGKDSTGELVGGSIILSAPLFIAKGIELSKLLSAQREQYKFGNFVHPETGEILDINAPKRIIFFDTPGKYQEVTVITIWSLLHEGYPGRPWSYLDVCGLAVVPVDEHHTRFRRVGYVDFQIRERESDKNIDLQEEIAANIPTKIVEII